MRTYYHKRDVVDVQIHCHWGMQKACVPMRIRALGHQIHGLEAAVGQPRSHVIEYK